MLDDPLRAPIEVHTSDRQNFKRCRRRWDLSSPIRQGLTGLGESNVHLWFGSGVHFALEDYHGYNRYEKPYNAFLAYYVATKRQHPPEAPEMLELAEKMFRHYHHWLPKQEPFDTLWTRVDPGLVATPSHGEEVIAGGLKAAKPQVEVNWHIPLEIRGPLGEPVFYSGTFDRVVRDAEGRLWIVDYKTAQRIDTRKLDTDPQVNAYMWAAHELYDEVPEGLIYIQMLKDAPHPPQELSDGTFSINKTQRTTSYLYAQALTSKFGRKRGQIPRKNVEFYEWLKEQEATSGDRFISLERVRRNEAVISAEESKIYYEAADMVDQDLPLYPNPTRDCSWDCNFKTVCLAMDDGGDYQGLLQENFQVQRIGDRHQWRQSLPKPQELLDWLEEQKAQEQAQ